MAALSWLAAAAPVIALTAAFAAMLLILEDLYVWLKGGDSLIGEMLPKMRDFMDAVKQHNTGEPPWLYWLREGAALVDRVLYGWQLIASITRGEDTQAVIKNFEAPARGAPPGAVVSDRFGGGASPGATAAASSTSNRQVNHITHNITVNAPAGSNPQDIAGEVKKALDEHTGALVRQTAVGTGVQ